jgi:DNA-binding CsgD family transcriptional regulator
MVRLLLTSEIDGEWATIEQLHAEAGVPLAADERERVAAWLGRNPGVFHLCETCGRLAGCVSLISIGRECFERRVAGGVGAPAAPTSAEILSGEEQAAAEWEGVWIWMERLVCATVAAQRELVVHVWRALGQMHLKGLLATAPDMEARAACRWLGLKEVCSGPAGSACGMVWYADAARVGPAADQPLGPPTPARCLFLLVEQRFGPRPEGLALTPAERRVARLFYGEDREAEEIAGRLGMQPGTVKTHLQRIRGKAERVVGSRLSRRIAAYLAEHPGEMVEVPPASSPPLK